MRWCGWAGDLEPAVPRQQVSSKVYSTTQEQGDDDDKEECSQEEEEPQQPASAVDAEMV